MKKKNRIGKLESNINKGYPKRLALTYACNQPGSIPPVPGAGSNMLSRIMSIGAATPQQGTIFNRLPSILKSSTSFPTMPGFNPPWRPKR